ncbi:cupin domain-containing protein [Paenibacillus puerhi]|uniref:cupin domain-containing protein n=1 Tax=Paenibacillus puerhi TaxID=2692622 RepID=UPI00135C1875|nr:cupin domain-containing protein [Paenibacillus puerhi]
MIIRNFYEAELKLQSSHKGEGLVGNVRLFDKADFESSLRFFYYTEIPPQASIGTHRHGQDEEIYVILEGMGTITVNGQSQEVRRGDVILNKPGWSHGLTNNTNDPLRMIVFEAAL